MYIRFDEIKNEYQFFEWAADYMCVGDQLKKSYDDSKGDTYKVYNSCGCLLCEWSEEGGPKSY